MDTTVELKLIVNAIVFAVLGLVVLAGSFITFDRLTPWHLWKEIIEEHNMALAIVVGAVTLAVAQIISAAIHG